MAHQTTGSETATAPDRDTVDIYHVWTGGESMEENSGAYGWELLSPQEAERMARFRFAADRRLYGAAHVLLRRALSRCAPDVAPAVWRFTSDARGRPEIAGPTGQKALRFSLSHTRGLAACVITRHITCGIDVEACDRATDAAALAERILTPRERAQVAALPPGALLDGFLRYWTLKEAYAKGRGLGLALPFDRIAFKLEEDGATLLADPTLDGPASAWRFLQWRPGSGHVAALALEHRGGSAPRFRMHTIPLVTGN